MFCNKCGKELPTGAVFCSSCGNKIRQPDVMPESQREAGQPQTPKTDVQQIQPEQVNYQNVQQPSQPTTSDVTSVQDAVMNSINSLKANIDIEKGVEKIKEQSKKFNKKLLIPISVLLAVIIVCAVIISSYSQTSDVRKALKENDATSLYYAYSSAYGDFEKTKKYDELIADKIEDITNSLEDYDFKKAVEESNEAVADWRAQFGSLLSLKGDYSLRDSLSSSNLIKVQQLEEKIASKQNYCDGLYAAKNEDYQGAINSLSEVSEADDDLEEVAELLEECATAYIDTVLKEVDNNLSGGDVSTGISLLQTAVDYLENNNISSQDVTTKINETKANYAATYAQKAEAALKNKDAGGAIGNIDVAIELQPDNNDYKVKRTTYEQYLPYKLYELDNAYQTSGSIYYSETKVANDNKDYKYLIVVDNGRDMAETGTAVYNLEGKYNTVTGKLFVSQAAKSERQMFYFEAYGDGKLIYTSPKLTEGVLPQDVSFDVDGIQNLQIKFWGSGWTSLFLSEFVAQKDFPSE